MKTLKNLGRLALTGALIFGLNNCKNYHDKKVKEFMGEMKAKIEYEVHDTDSTMKGKVYYHNGQLYEKRGDSEKSFFDVLRRKRYYEFSLYCYKKADSLGIVGSNERKDNLLLKIKK